MSERKELLETGASSRSKSRAKASALIVGGGPAGTTAAAGLANLDFDVVVIEKQPDPRRSPVDATRSFNVTLSTLGLEASGAAKAAIQKRGQPITGRRIYADRGFYDRPYGLRPTDGFLAIPRADLAIILTVTAEEAGVRFIFGCEAIKMSRTGAVEYCEEGSQVIQALSADLTVFADGVCGAGRSVLGGRPSCSYSKSPDSTTYVKFDVSALEAEIAGLPADRISFFPSSSALLIGIPNRDASVSFLLLSDDSGHNTRFHNRDEAVRFLREGAPRFFTLFPDSPGRIVDRATQYFTTAGLSDWVVGDSIAVLGDAARCSPPYAGAGAAAAMNDAATLCRCIGTHRTLGEALQAFQTNRRMAAHVWQQMVNSQGRLLKAKMRSTTYRAASALRVRGERWLGLRSLYQTAVFEPGGFERLIEREFDACRMLSIDPARDFVSWANAHAR